MQQPVPQFAERISKIAQRRSRAWGWLGDLWDCSDAFIDTVRDGSFGDNMREHFSSIGQEAIAIGPLMSLDVYSRGSRRRDRESDLHVFRADHGEFVGKAPLADIATMVDLCKRESAAWAAGDIGGGRDARRAEFETLEGGLEQTLAELCQEIADNAETHVWRTLGRLIQVFLATETGHQSMVTTAGNLK